MSPALPYHDRAANRRSSAGSLPYAATQGGKFAAGQFMQPAWRAAIWCFSSAHSPKVRS
jgi:hypothetical protein